jgi:hypothetical protein
VTTRATPFFAFSKVFAVFLGAAACGGEVPTASAPASAPRSGSPVERYFPLEDGRIYHYVTREGDDTGMLVARVARTGEDRGELRLSNATKRFVYAPDGVAYEGGGAYVLKAPLEVGATWAGEHGGTTRITRTDADVAGLAGRYAGCLETVEEGGRIEGARYASTYCPGVGMVLLEVTAGGDAARAELKSYGAPVAIE